MQQVVGFDVVVGELLERLALLSHLGQLGILLQLLKDGSRFMMILFDGILIDELTRQLLLGRLNLVVDSDGFRKDFLLLLALIFGRRLDSTHLLLGLLAGLRQIDLLTLDLLDEVKDHLDDAGGLIELFVEHGSFEFHVKLFHLFGVISLHMNIFLEHGQPFHQGLLLLKRALNPVQLEQPHVLVDDGVVHGVEFTLELVVLLVGDTDATHKFSDVLAEALIERRRVLQLGFFIDTLQETEASAQRLHEDARLGRRQIVVVEAVLAACILLLDFLDELGDGNDLVEALRCNLHFQFVSHVAHVQVALGAGKVNTARAHAVVVEARRAGGR